MNNTPNEICDPTPLMDLCLGAANAFSMIYSSYQWAGGTPPEFPDIHLPLQCYSGGLTRWELEDRWKEGEDAYDWSKIALWSYIGIPEVFRTHYSGVVADFKSLFPVYSGVPELELIFSCDNEEFLDVDWEPITNGVWYQKHWATEANRWAWRGICPPPAYVRWHGTWPSGYEYSTIPELWDAFHVVEFLGSQMLDAHSIFDIEHAQTWQTLNSRTRGYSFAGYSENSTVEDWAGAGAIVEMTSYLVNDTSGFVPLDVSCVAATAGGSPFAADHTCYSRIWISVILQGAGGIGSGELGQPADYAAIISRLVQSPDPGASLAVSVSHADFQPLYPGPWPWMDDQHRPLLAPFSAVRIQASIQVNSSVICRTTAPSGSYLEWDQQQSVGDSYAYLRVGPYEYSASA